MRSGQEGVPGFREKEISQARRGQGLGGCLGPGARGQGLGVVREDPVKGSCAEEGPVEQFSTGFSGTGVPDRRTSWRKVQWSWGSGYVVGGPGMGSGQRFQISGPGEESRGSSVS